jgi:hypothetical protein
MRRYAFVWILVIAAAVIPVACKKSPPVKGVELTVTFAEATLSDNLITDVTYTWKTLADFVPMDKDYSVFAHYWHNTNMLFGDDYVPEVPTSKWEKGKTYSVTKRIYIPKFIDEFDPQFKGEETLRLSVGFFNPFDRTGQSEKEMLSKKLKVVPPPIGTPEVIYQTGWYDLETNPNSVLKQWRWTSKEAKCVIDNPKKDALLVIRGGVNLSAVKDQKVMFKINDVVLDEFVATQELFDKTYNIKKEQLGDKNEFTLSIAVDRPWVPAKVLPNSKDVRELGVQVSFVYFR